MWRLRRLQRVETSVHALGAEDMRLGREVGIMYINMTGGPGPGAGPVSHEVYEGQAWLRKAIDPDAWLGLQRAEANLERVLYRALATLAGFQGPRATWKATASPHLAQLPP
jgi:hypothetical protein